MAGFSYAEAAKGRTPAPSTSPLPKEDQTTDQAPQNGITPATPLEKKPSLDTPSQADIERNASEETLKIDESVESISKGTVSKSHSISAASSTQSPSLAESAATLIKDDEINGTANDSESTTWEKVSQGSQPQEKVATKSNGGSDDSKNSENWEHVPAPQPALKEATPPTINPWVKRAQDAHAKAKTSSPTGNGQSSLPNSTADLSQQRKKSRASVSEANGAKLGDKAAKLDDGPTRRYKPSSETRLATRLPPPTSDAVSWPTPDSAKPDDKEKDKSKASSRERSDSIDQDKDKMAAGKRGKKQWEHVEFVPTAVFNTPLPTGRRGGRPGPRGGREGATGRGAANAAGTDRASDGEARTSSTEAPVESNRGEVGHGRPNQGPPRAKRMSNAAQTKPRDFKKGEFEAGRSEDVRVNGGDSAAEDASKDGHSIASGPGFDGSQVHPHGAAFQQDLANGGEPVDAAAFQEGRPPRQFRDERREFGNGMPREARSERGGRGGHRGRGNYNHFPHNSHAAGNNYSANMPYGNAKAHGYQDRAGQYQGYASPREGKHNRSASRSQQSGPPSATRFGGFPNMPPYAGAPVPPEMANAYGFPPSQSPQFYHPSMDQAPLVGIIAEQMRYYFSVDNLLRDTYLRSRMDDQGFIPLDFMMPWRRMKMMTSDITLVRFAVQQVPYIELRLDVNGVDYIRPANDWNQWVLKREERLEEARNDGPNLQPSVPVSHQYAPPHMFQNQYPPMFPQQGYPPRQFSNKAMNGGASHADQMGIHVPNGLVNDSANQTPLSATVPEFQPNPDFGSQNLVNGGIDAFANGQGPNPGLANKGSGSSNEMTNGVHESSARDQAKSAVAETSSGPVVATSSDAE